MWSRHVLAKWSKRRDETSHQVRLSRRRHSTHHHKRTLNRGSGTSTQCSQILSEIHLWRTHSTTSTFFSTICGRGTSTIAQRSAVALVHRVLSLWWSNHLDLIVDGANVVSSFVMRSTIPWNMAVPPDVTTLTYNSLRMSTSHFTTNWKEVSLNPLAPLHKEVSPKCFQTRGYGTWLKKKLRIYSDGKHKYVQLFPLVYQLAITVTVGMAARNSIFDTVTVVVVARNELQITVTIAVAARKDRK